jgi:hypothetical protein
MYLGAAKYSLGEDNESEQRGERRLWLEISGIRKVSKRFLAGEADTIRCGAKSPDPLVGRVGAKSKRLRR